MGICRSVSFAIFLFHNAYDVPVSFLLAIMSAQRRDVSERLHTPKVAFVAPLQSYVSSCDKQINADDIDLNVRALSMGKLHHAMMGAAAVAIGTAAPIPGTLVNLAACGERDAVIFGHPSGTLKVGTEAVEGENGWTVNKVVMSRSARVLMEGWVRIPNVFLEK